MNFSDRDVFFMQQALKQAQLAREIGEVPIGAVLVCDDKIISKAYNSTITNNDPTAHAEVLVIRQAAAHVGNYRLSNTKLYVTLEPCIMCLGAMVQARIEKLIYAVADTRVGVISSDEYHKNKNLNHKISVECGLLEQESKALLKTFFVEKRKSKS